MNIDEKSFFFNLFRRICRTTYATVYNYFIKVLFVSSQKPKRMNALKKCINTLTDSLTFLIKDKLSSDDSFYIGYITSHKECR